MLKYFDGQDESSVSVIIENESGGVLKISLNSYLIIIHDCPHTGFSRISYAYLVRFTS